MRTWHLRWTGFCGCAVNERGQIAGIRLQILLRILLADFLLSPFFGRREDAGPRHASEQFWCLSHLNNEVRSLAFQTWRDLAAHPYVGRGKDDRSRCLGRDFGLANWINNAGEVVGGVHHADDQFHAVLWTHGGRPIWAL